jgi:predicted nucleic acid-binding OB-fold protein
MSAKDNFLKVKHLYNRAGFGVSYTDLQKLSKKNLDKVVDNMLKDSQKDDPINLVNDF